MKIIQILIAPESIRWSDRLIGLGDDGGVYRAIDGEWIVIQPAPEEKK